MTNYNVEEKDLYGEQSITVEHIQNNQSVPEMLVRRSIKPKKRPPDEDIKKVERRIEKEEKQIAEGTKKLPTKKKSEK